jgi:agmatine/peptidylarginine deiminase
MPAEWEPHEATWLSWPHKEESWPGAFVPVAAIFAEITRHLASSELVRINVADERPRQQPGNCWRKQRSISHRSTSTISLLTMPG